MDESGGFFKVYRKAQHSAFWTKKPYVNYRGVWLTMLMMTNWKEGFFDGHTIKVGQFATSTESLSKACGLSIKQVRNVVDTMKEMGMVTVENVANRFSLVTICNWATYNGEESRKGQTEGKLGANQGQTEGKLGATIEEVKKGRMEEDKKNNPPNPQGGMVGDSQQELFPNNNFPDVKSNTEQKVHAKSKKAMRVKENSQLMIRIGSWFNRNADTLWSVDESERLKSVNPTEDELNEIEKFYTFKCTSGEKLFRRHDVSTLLNNWAGEYGKAKTHNSKTRTFSKSGLEVPSNDELKAMGPKWGTNRAE